METFLFFLDLTLFLFLSLFLFKKALFSSIKYLFGENIKDSFKRGCFLLKIAFIILLFSGVIFYTFLKINHLNMIYLYPFFLGGLYFIYFWQKYINEGNIRMKAYKKDGAWIYEGLSLTFPMPHL